MKTKFLQVYANLSLLQRSEVIVVLGDEPLTWHAARIEVENDTQAGKEILEKLARMEILKLKKQEEVDLT